MDEKMEELLNALEKAQVRIQWHEGRADPEDEVRLHIEAVLTKHGRFKPTPGQRDGVGD